MVNKFKAFNAKELQFLFKAITAYGTAINSFGANTKGTPLTLLDEIADEMQERGLMKKERVVSYYNVLGEHFEKHPYKAGVSK